MKKRRKKVERDGIESVCKLVCMWDQAGEINGEMGLKKVKWQKKERKYWGHTDGHWILLRIEWTHLWKTTVYSPFIERIAILTSCSLCEVEAISDDDWVWGTLWWKNRAHCIHITISHHIGICGSLPLTFAKIEGLAQRKVNRWLNSNGLCHWTFYQWESNSRAVSEFQFSFRLRYVPAFYSLHLYAS